MIKYGETSEKVKDLQIRLQRFGLEPGPIDSIFGPLTLAAWTRFEQEHLIDYKVVTDEEFEQLKMLAPDTPESISSRTLITYYISSDVNGKLKKTAKLACNFWNRFILPKSNIVIRLGTFYNPGRTIAVSYQPYKNDSTVYGRIEFNTKYLTEFTNYEIAGTIIHEIGHTLGFGWDKWMNLFDPNTGMFKSTYIQKIPELQYMFVETDYGPGTEYSHWDEERFDKELMTGFKDTYEYVLPITIKVMRLLGHTVVEGLTKKTDLGKLIQEVDGIMFSMAEEVKKINLEYFEETEIAEEVYTYAFRGKSGD